MKITVNALFGIQLATVGELTGFVRRSGEDNITGVAQFYQQMSFIVRTND